MLRKLFAPMLVALVMTSGSLAYAQSCEGLTDFQLPGVDVEIRSAEALAASTGGAPGGPLPAHCRVDGVIDERIGANGATFGINFALALPEDWNGRFLFQGGGGLNGAVRPPVGNQATGGDSALSRGFAVVSTDTGHTGSGFDGSFMEDQQAALDFFYVAIGRVTTLSKELVADYYERPPEGSYFVGCSTGGREAMLMSQRYPSYYDGIVSGAPAMRTGHSNMSLAYINASFNEFAPRNADGAPQLADLFSESDKALIVDSLANTCDSRDGLEDGMIFNTRSCNFDPGILSCEGAKTDMCLIAPQVSALGKAFTGPIDSLGHQVYARFPWDTGLNNSGGGLPGIIQSGGSSPVQSQATSVDFDVDRAQAALIADTMGRTGDSTLTNLGTFSRNGGKLLFYHGMSDPWFSALDTVAYYERMSAANGGMDEVRDWSRLFLSPGMGHCGGGSAALDSFDMLTALVDWVEEGIAPDTVISTGSAFPGRSRPMCAFPEYPHYTGEGDPESADSFECRE
jgi:hypothetical protein